MRKSSSPPPSSAPAGRAAGAPVGASSPARGRGAGEVRLIGGVWKRTRIPVLDSPGLRPTPDRVRETLFNWLGQQLDHWRVLDAYAGTGALGLEAASRGASRVVLLEREPKLVRHLNTVVERLKAQDRVQVAQADALAWMASAAPASFDLVLLDPPFDADLFIASLQRARALIAPSGWIYLEADRPLTDEELQPLGLRIHRQGRAGAVHHHLLHRGDPA